jgi:hypothetical protein
MARIVIASPDDADYAEVITALLRKAVGARSPGTTSFSKGFMIASPIIRVTPGYWAISRRPEQSPRSAQGAPSGPTQHPD